MKPNQTSVEENGTRKRILEAAVQLFSQKGYDATRVNEIAEKAKVTKGLIYYFLKAKKRSWIICLICYWKTLPPWSWPMYIPTLSA